MSTGFGLFRNRDLLTAHEHVLNTVKPVLRGSQWGGGFYGYRLKFWLFYGYRLILSVTVNEKVKN